MVVGRRKLDVKDCFRFSVDVIESVSACTYLGVFYKSNGNMRTHIYIIKNIASRATFTLLKKIKTTWFIY